MNTCVDNKNTDIYLVRTMRFISYAVKILESIIIQQEKLIREVNISFNNNYIIYELL
jgi:hypothetical protein